MPCTSKSGEDAKLVKPVPTSILGKRLLNKGGLVGVWGLALGPHSLTSREGCHQGNVMEVFPMSKKENIPLPICLALDSVQH